MKRFKYGLSWLALAACALFAGACNDDETEGVDVVETTRVKEIGYQSAVCVGYVKGVCSERGVCYFDEAAPDRVLTVTAPRSGEAFEVTLSDLETGHDYRCYVYARVNGEVLKGETKTFRTLEEGQPYLLAGEVLNVAHTSATLDGYVFTAGGSEILERGFCYGTVEEPTLDDETCTAVPVEGGLGQMTADVTELADKTDYFVRIYMRNAEGLYYSPAASFRTLKYNKPVVSIVGFERRGDKIVVRAETSVLDPADEELETRRGICVGDTDNYEQGTEYTASTTGIGSYEVEIPAGGNVGFIWAWAGNKEGKEISNVATSRASVRLEPDMDVRSRMISSALTVENRGIFDAEVTEAGVCWSAASTEPTVAGDHRALGTTSDKLEPSTTHTLPLFFDASLKPNTAYHFRAYVTNEYGTAYSKAVEITMAPDLFDTHAKSVSGTRKGGKTGPDFNAWQIICNEPQLASSASYMNNVPREKLTVAFCSLYEKWDDMLIESTSSAKKMCGFIYKIQSMEEVNGQVTKGVIVLRFFLWTGRSGTEYDHTFNFTRDAEGQILFSDIKRGTKGAATYNGLTEATRTELDKVYSNFTEHPFYLEWGIPEEEFDKKVIGTTSQNTTTSPNRKDGPIWMVRVDEPENYWTMTEKHE